MELLNRETFDNGVELKTGYVETTTGEKLYTYQLFFEKYFIGFLAAGQLDKKLCASHGRLRAANIAVRKTDSHLIVDDWQGQKLFNLL